jgi:uncharacterized repeat protein (TIGR03803 family)
MKNKNQSSSVIRLLMASIIVLGASSFANAANEQIIYPFSYLYGGGAVFPGALIFDRTGNLYGAAAGGGIGYGAIFELSPSPVGSWNITILHNFSGNAGDGGDGDGAEPVGVIFDAAGNLYGATQSGGGSGCGGAGCGVIFELSPASTGWTETILYTFTGGEDGGSPGGVTIDAKGNLYGAAYGGGSTSNCNDGCGTIFTLARTSNSWKFRVLHTFTDGSDGGQPIGTLALHSGALYGTAEFGGNLSCNSGFGFPGCGTVFTIRPATSGGKFGILHTFSGGNDGSAPVGGVIFDRAGNAYGATGVGGSANFGVVFKLEPGSTGWTETILHNFSEGSDGFSALGALTLDKAGNVYGATALGSGPVHDDDGIVYELTPQSDGSWMETILHSFTGLLDGQNPSSGVILDTKGNLYGSTSGGGSGNGGTVYEIAH